MKHIQKIVKIAATLTEVFMFTSEQITSFINTVSCHEANLREFNEAIALNNYKKETIALSNYKNDSLIKERTKAENQARIYIHEILGYDVPVEISHDLRECPIKMALGKEYANYEDNKSFVIDL